MPQNDDISDRTSKEVVKVKEGHDWCPHKRKCGDKYAHAQRKDHVETQRRQPSISQGETGSEWSPAETLILAF